MGGDTGDQVVEDCRGSEGGLRSLGEIERGAVGLCHNLSAGGGEGRDVGLRMPTRGG